MRSNMTEPPGNIRAHQSDQVLELSWEGVEAAKLPYREIRGQCPCASCRDEWTGERILDPASIRADLKLESMDPVGNYAVRLSWNDGHSSGLYTWDLLKQTGGEVGQKRWMGVDPPSSPPASEAAGRPDVDHRRAADL